MEKQQNKKVVVICLDGANWDILKPWAEKGWLPNINRFLEKGTSTNLITTLPPVTGPAWVSFATGKNPGAHGCYNFAIPTDSLLNVDPISTEKIKGKTFYEILENDGKKSILINMPCSFPPRIGA
ncbi:MAG: Type I phosphodiesterase/nucleotide pyrophosphatase [Candidatus Levybacteria bacterium GW2011_GWA1_39_32]|nr:MAG: Type I phosphodiesterase/nucleotide pyrophosphatase [Candidatus Levybacteria bacterium GW2011_GWA1_39_32]